MLTCGLATPTNFELIANDAGKSEAEVFETRDDGAADFNRHVFGTRSRQLDAAALKEPRPEPIEMV